MQLGPELFSLEDNQWWATKLTPEQLHQVLASIGQVTTHWHASRKILNRQQIDALRHLGAVVRSIRRDAPDRDCHATLEELRPELAKDTWCRWTKNLTGEQLVLFLIPVVVLSWAGRIWPNTAHMAVEHRASINLLWFLKMYAPQRRWETVTTYYQHCPSIATY
jgi:hypothetical protein